MSDVKNSEFELVTYKEVIAIFFVFSFVLILLYPKDMLQKQILAEKSNYDLTAIYLENMLRLDPENETLMLVLTKISIDAKNTDLAEKLLAVLYDSNNEATQRKLYPLSYKLAKQTYLFTEISEQKRKIREKMETFFHVIMTRNYYTDEEIPYWYNEAIFLEDDYKALKFLEAMLKQKPDDTHWLEQGLYLAEKLHSTDDQKHYLKQLQLYDKKRLTKWMEAEYYLAMELQENDNVKALLIQLAERSMPWKEKLAEFYLQRKEYKKASDCYMLCFTDETDVQKKRDYFINALQTLQYGSKFHAVVKLAKKYEAYYVDDTAMMKRFLKLYLAADRLDAAQSLSKKLMVR